MNNNVNIPQDEYDRLIDDSAKLAALENWGVDNWNGYDDALAEYNKDKERESELDALIEDIVVICSENCDINPAGPGTGVAIYPDMASLRKLLLDWAESRQS